MIYLSALMLSFVCITEARSAERQLDAHAHGYGELNVAIDGPKVALELNSPAFNIVGFEHSPETDKDKATIKNALSILNDGSGLFLFPAVAGCRLANVNVVSSLTEAQHSVHKEHDSDHKDQASDHKDQASDHKEHDSDHKDQASDHKEHDSYVIIKSTTVIIKIKPVIIKSTTVIIKIKPVIIKLQSMRIIPIMTFILNFMQITNFNVMSLKKLIQFKL
jgi:hypothetical protein